MSEPTPDGLALNFEFVKSQKDSCLVSKSYLLPESRIKPNKKLQAQYARTKPNTPPQIFNMMTTQAMAMKVAHAILTIETQGVLQFLDYTGRIQKEAREKKKGSRANKWLSSNTDWKIALKIAKSNNVTTILNPAPAAKLDKEVKVTLLQILV